MPIYQVPPDCYLVLTTGMFLPADTAWNRPDAALIEDVCGNETLKLAACWMASHYYPDPNGSTFIIGHVDQIDFSDGLVFRPGSQVAFKNSSAPNPGIQYQLIGYLVRI